MASMVRGGAGLRRDPSGDLAIHGPLPAGTSQLSLSYKLPATSDGASLISQIVPFDASR